MRGGASGRSFSLNLVYLFILDFSFFGYAYLSCGMWGLQSLLQHAGSLCLWHAMNSLIRITPGPL